MNSWKVIITTIKKNEFDNRRSSRDFDTEEEAQDLLARKDVI